MNLRDFLAILRGRWLLIALPTLLAVMLGLGYLATAARVYTGVTSILIDARVRPAVGDNTSVLTGISPDAVLVESQVRLISSDPVMRRVVEAEGLADDPEFVRDSVGLRTRLFGLFGIIRAKAPSPLDNVTRAAIALVSHVVVKRSERTYIADIEVTADEPMKAARIANAVAKAYLADQQATRNDSADRDSEWVRTQVGDMQARLQEAEVKVDAFRREHGMIDTNGKVLSEQELADASANLTQARSRATDVKARLDQIGSIKTSGRSIDALPEALKSPLVDKLRGQYADVSRQQATLRQTLGDRHPALLESEQQLRDIRRLIAEELTRVQAGVANEYQTAQASVAALDRHVQDLKRATGDSNESRVKLDELQRDVDARRTVYDRFLRARDTVREQAVDAPIGRIIAPAIAPGGPSWPKPFAVLVLAGAIGFGIGIGLALAADMMFAGPSPDATRRATPGRELVPAAAPAADAPAIPVLGYVPSPFGNAARLTSRGWLFDRLRTAWPTTIDGEHVPSLPAFRTAVQALGLLGPEPERMSSPVTVLLTSAVAFDSRTTLALGLAEAAAAAGRRALVVDANGDGPLLRELVVPSARPVLMNLMGTTRLCFRVMAPYRGSLSIVPMLANEAQLARRLDGQPGTAEIDGIAGHFDFVVFDGPVFGDPRFAAIAAAFDRVVLVAPRDVTRDDVDAAAQAALSRLPERSLAAVLVADLAAGLRPSEAA